MDGTVSVESAKETGLIWMAWMGIWILPARILYLKTNHMLIYEG